MKELPKVYTNPDTAIADASMKSFLQGLPFHVWRWPEGTYTMAESTTVHHTATIYAKADGFEVELR